MELNQYDVDTYEQILHSIGIDIVNRTAVVSISSINYVVSMRSINYFDDVSMIPMSERRLMGYEVRVDNNVIVYFDRLEIKREELIAYLSALVSMDYIFIKNDCGLWHHVRSLKSYLVQSLKDYNNLCYRFVQSILSGCGNDPTFPTLDIVELSNNIKIMNNLVSIFIKANMDIFDYKFLFAIPDLRDNFIQTCMQYNNGNLFSIALRKLSHEYVLDILDYTTKEEWHEGTVLVEQRLAEFLQEDNRKRFDL